MKGIARLASLLLSIALAAPGRAAPADADQLYVRDLAFEPIAKHAKLAAALKTTRESGYTIVQHQAGSGDAVYKAILAAGGKVFGYVPRDGLLVGGVPLAKLKKIAGVRFAEVYQPAYKLDPTLRVIAEGGTPKPTKRRKTTVPYKAQAELVLAVDVFKDAAGVAQEVGKLGGKATVLKRAGADVLVVKLPTKQLAKLAALGEVRTIDWAALPKKVLDRAPVVTNIRQSLTAPWTNIDGLTGNGQRLGTYDTGCDTGVSNTLVPDLRNRVTGDIANWINTIQNPSWAGLTYSGAPDSHGTLTTDVAIGNGAQSANGLLAGVAFQATAQMRPFNADVAVLTPGYLNVTEALTNSFAWGALVHNDSWVPANGTYDPGDPPTYGLTAIVNVYSPQASGAVDTFAYANPTMLIVTAAANEGPAANTISTLACSKDSITIGASGNGVPPSGAVPPNDAGAPDYDGATAIDEVADFSSRGPAPAPAVAGRLKPDMVAPGALIAATCLTAGPCPEDPDLGPYINEPRYEYVPGTSFAAPMVSGAALLIREYLNTYAQFPTGTGMLVKALLINGATELYDYVPDENQGWGLLNLYASLNGNGPGTGDVYYWDSLGEPDVQFSFVQTGQSVVFENVSFSPGTSLAITLAWFDPADGGNAGALVNDLDLSLTTQNGTVYHGGVPSMANGVTTAGGAADHLNSVEKLILANTPAQPATITVTAYNIAAQSRQGFAIVVNSVTGQGTTTKLHKLEKRAVPKNLKTPPPRKKR